MNRRDLLALRRALRAGRFPAVAAGLYVLPPVASDTIRARGDRQEDLERVATPGEYLAAREVPR